MTTKKLTKLLALYLPYILLGLAATNFGEAWRLAEGKELGDKIMSMMGTIPMAFANPLPSLHPLDLLVGLCCGAGLRLAVYLRGKNAKKYRHGMEYGSARWSAYDITADELLSGAGGNTATKTEQAEKLILDLLADGKELASEDIVKAAAEAGISERTVQNAKRNMGGILGARRVGGQWYNFIKKKQPPEPAS